MDSSIQIEERAARWLARRESGAWTQAEEAELNAWLDASTFHMVAYVRLEAAWSQARRLKALKGDASAGAVPSPEGWRLTPVVHGSAAADDTRSTPTGGAAMDEPSAPRPVSSAKSHAHPAARWAVAASVLFLIATVAAYLNWSAQPTYRTPVGGIAVVPMSDGSKITLNTNSKVHVAVTESERRVELERGEAFFEVAKDPARPFVVHAGRKRVVAVGTAFSVRREGAEVRVFVSEGVVRIEDDAVAPQPSARDEQELLTLEAGSIARASEAEVLVQESTAAAIENYLSWRTGRLIFRDTVLAEAIAEFNRYNDRQIVIADPSVAQIRVSGRFRSTQYEAFVRLIEQGFSVRARHLGNQIVLTDARAPRDAPVADVR